MSCNSFWLRSRPKWISLTPATSQREAWFQVTPWIAEFWCCLSNVGFLYVAYRHQAKGVAFAGVVSMVSHAIPWKPLLWLDKVGVLVALGSTASRLWAKGITFPVLLRGAMSLVCLNGLDFVLSKNQNLWPWPHIFWHLGSAALAFYFLK